MLGKSLSRSTCHPKKQLVHCPIFEDAVRKILSGELLNVEEKKAVMFLTLEPGPNQASSSNQDAQDFATRALQKRQRLGVERLYNNCKFILPTSNMVEGSSAQQGTHTTTGDKD